jgi:E3 ubiquitin-protein ligase DOA10
MMLSCSYSLNLVTSLLSYIQTQDITQVEEFCFLPCIKYKFYSKLFVAWDRCTPFFP